RVLNVLVVLKVAALALLVGAAFFGASHATWWSESREPVARAGSTIVAFGAALVPILFTYGGWQSVNYVGEEIVDARRNLPIALVSRRSAPLGTRPPDACRAPGSPIVQIAFVLAAAAVVASTIGAAPAAAAKGALLLALGVPVYFWYSRRHVHNSTHNPRWTA